MSEAKTYNASDADADVVVLGVGTCAEELSLRLLGARTFTQARDSYLPDPHH
jgi:hypothetical protein